MGKYDAIEDGMPVKRIEPADLRVECQKCGGYGKRRGLTGLLARWNGTACTDCMGHGVHIPRKVDI